MKNLTMMKQKSLLVFCLFCFLNISCRRNSFREVYSFRRIENSDTTYNFNNVPPEEQCGNSIACRRACGYIYQFVAEQDRCIRKSIQDVETIYRVSQYLRDPVALNLISITEAEFLLFLDSGTEALNYYIEDYNVSESRRFLRWIAESRNISNILFQLGTANFRRILINLLSVSPSAELALHASLDSGRTFFRIANNQSNGWAIWMMHQVIAEDLCEPLQYYYGVDPLSAPEACVIRVYCHYRERQYIHANDFPYISRVIEYETVFDYIRDGYPIGLNLNFDALNLQICETVCSSYRGSCSPSYTY